METENNVQKSWRTRQQKEELILQWQQSGKSRKEFCQEHGISYNSLVGWCKYFKDQKKTTGFAEVKIEKDSSLFAQVHLPGGIKIDFYQSVAAEYFQSLIRK
jgi:transposase-like protein